MKVIWFVKASEDRNRAKSFSLLVAELMTLYKSAINPKNKFFLPRSSRWYMRVVSPVVQDVAV